MPDISLTVNGATRTGSPEARKTLADFLRDDLSLTGTHLGCEHGVCGACTVILDGRPVRSCLMLAVQAAGIDPPSDLHGSAEYRKKVAAALVRRGLREAVGNAMRGND